VIAILSLDHLATRKAVGHQFFKVELSQHVAGGAFEGFGVKTDVLALLFAEIILLYYLHVPAYPLDNGKCNDD